MQLPTEVRKPAHRTPPGNIGLINLLLHAVSWFSNNAIVTCNDFIAFIVRRPFVVRRLEETEVTVEEWPSMQDGNVLRIRTTQSRNSQVAVTHCLMLPKNAGLRLAGSHSFWQDVPKQDW